MYLVYIGESGNTGASVNDPSQPHQVYTGLLVHERQSVSMNGEFNALCRRHFGSPLGEGGTPSELRPVDVYQGLNYFSSWPALKRAELIQDCLNIMVRRETPVITSYISKQDLADAKAAGDSPGALLWDNPSVPMIGKFLFALNMFMDEVTMSSMSEDEIMSGALPIADFALLVAQGGRTIKPEYMTNFLQSDDGIDATAVVENFCFVEPEHSVGSQLANLCAYFVRRWLQDPSKPHPYFDGLRENKVVQVIYPVNL